MRTNYLRLSSLVGMFAGALLVPAQVAHAAGSYEVFALPLENPDDGPRTVEVDPNLADPVASPFGWHDTDGTAGPEYTITRGNNVHAYLDRDADNAPDVGGSPDGGAALSFQFPLDLALDPSTYGEASVTNAFYWTNRLHDILYNAGFNEAWGNFQESTYGNGGLGGDAILLEVQDGFVSSNANVDVGPDGVPPRFQIGVFFPATPDRDGALSGFLLGFLYGEAMSRRLVGGPATSTCLSAAESNAMAYGTSDWLGLVVTAKADDAGADLRPVGTYLLGEPPTGPGIRPAPYSTDFSINPNTYGDLGSLGPAQSQGMVWALMLWEMYWKLVDARGYSADLNADISAGGNVLALHLVVEALKSVPCNPGFVDGRDALLSADVALTGGENCALIWEAFARRGLGFSADQGSSSSTADGTEAFDTPPAGTCDPVVAVGSHEIAPIAQLVATSPFRSRAAIALTLPTAEAVTVRVFDVRGRELATLADERLPAGFHRWSWDPSLDAELSSSTVFLRVTAGSYTSTRKLVHLR